MGARSPDLSSFVDEAAWALLEAVPDGMLIVDRQGLVVYGGDLAGDLLGCKPDELLGLPVEELVPDDVRARHRAHRTRYQAEPTNRPMGTGLLLRARRVDGSEFPVEISLSPLELGGVTYTVAALRDVTARVMVEDHLHRVLHSLDSSDEGVFIIDAESLRYSYVNEGAVRLVGYEHDELLEMTPLHLKPYVDEREYRRLVESLESDPDRSVLREATMLRKDGTEVPVETTYKAAPVGLDSSRWVIALARDISERLDAARELQNSQDALREAERAVVLADDRERIARDLHDTVIQRLFGAGLQLQGAMAAADPRVRERLQTTVDDLDETIRELRSAIFALQGPGQGPLGVRGRLLDVVQEAGDSVGFEPRLQFDGAIETMDDAIADNLVAVLREALSNIARHAGAGSVRITISSGDDVVLTVVDDGVGVPDEVLGGRGLGNLADRAAGLGGCFKVERAVGGGTRLEWQVPASPGPPRA